MTRPGIGEMSAALSPLDALNAELRAADETLVGNEDVLRAVLAGCGDCIKILDLSGQLQFMSEAGKRVMEVDDFSSVKGCPWPDFWHGDGHASARNAIDLARQGQTARFKGGASTAKGNQKFWDVQVSPILGRDGKPSHILSISRDITTEWQADLQLQDAAERQALLIAEMNHRINNTFAIIGAIAAQTIRGDDVAAARDAFTSRVILLARANRILLQNDGVGASVSDVVEGALAAHRPGANRLRVAGPSLSLPPKKALSLALAIHEMATNATKYGALSNDVGTIDILWRDDMIDGGSTFTFRWEEKGGPPVTERVPNRRGFGSRLIHHVFPHDFDGTVVTSYEPAGFVCELRAPLASVDDVGPII